jgi:hypothetical protein
MSRSLRSKLNSVEGMLRGLSLLEEGGDDEGQAREEGWGEEEEGGHESARACAADERPDGGGLEDKGCGVERSVPSGGARAEGKRIGSSERRGGEVSPLMSLSRLRAMHEMLRRQGGIKEGGDGLTKQVTL